MRILWIHIENFRCYKNVRIPEDDGVVLPTGLIVVEGENSTGKTSLFNAIFYALFYDPSQRDLGKKDDIIRRGAPETKVELAIEVDNICYLVKRFHSKNKPVDAILLKIDKTEAYEGKTKVIAKIAEGYKDVNNKIIEILNIDKNKVLNTLIVNQGEVQKLAEAEGAQLRDLIYELFQLEQYKEKLKLIVSEKKEKIEQEIEKNRITRTTEDIEKEIAEREDKVESLKSIIKEKEKEIKESEEKLSHYPKFDEIQQIKENIVKIDSKTREIKRTEKNIELEAKTYELSSPLSEDKIVQKRTSYSSKIKQIQDKIIELKEERDKLYSEKVTRKNELSSIEERKAKLTRDQQEGEPYTCELCEQTIDYEHYKELVGRLDKNIPILKQGIAKREKKIREIDREIKGLQETERNLNRMIVSLDNLKNDIKRLEEAKGELANIKQSLYSLLIKFNAETVDELSQKYGISKFDELLSIISDIRAEIRKLQTERKSTINQINDHLDSIERLNKQIELNKEKEKNIEELNKKSALLDEAQKLVEKFITEEIITNRLLAGIQDKTSENIILFTRGKYSQLYLEPTRTKTLIMKIKDQEDGFVKEQSYLSGGDKAAIGLGLRIGISELLKYIKPFKDSPYNPPRMDIMILDEPLAALDKERRRKVIEGLVNQKKFTQIFLITHTDIANEEKASKILIIKRKDGSHATFIPQPTEIEIEAEG